MMQNLAVLKARPKHLVKPFKLSLLNLFCRTWCQCPDLNHCGYQLMLLCKGIDYIILGLQASLQLHVLR